MATIIENEDRRVAGFIERLSTTNAGSQAPTRLMNRSLNTKPNCYFPGARRATRGWISSRPKCKSPPVLADRDQQKS
jgi:hypothetical protein